MKITFRKDELHESQDRIGRTDGLHESPFPNCETKLVRNNHEDSRKLSFQAGYSLIELLIYIGVLAVLMTVGYSAVYRAMDNSAALRRNADDIARAIRVGEIWRADIRNSYSTARLDSASAEPVLHLRKSGKEISYRFAEHTVFRRTGNSGWTPLLRNVKSCEFVSDPRAVTVWRWELELLPQRKKLSRTRPLFTFIAAQPALNPS